MANSKIYIVNKMIDHPVACLELDQIFSVQFITEEKDNTESGSVAQKTLDANPNPVEDDQSLLKIIYYDKSKFAAEINKNKDPFDAASKYLKIRFKRINKKVKSEFEQRISTEKQNNFAGFF